MSFDNAIGLIVSIVILGYLLITRPDRAQDVKKVVEALEQRRLVEYL